MKRNDLLTQHAGLMPPLPQMGCTERMCHRTAQQRYWLPLLGALVCLLLAVGTSQAEWVYLPSNSPTGLYDCPEHTRGDRDFAGNGPYVYVTVWLYIPSDGTSLWVNISALWRETKSDWSTASMYRSFLLYSPPPGQRIHYTLNGMPWTQGSSTRIRTGRGTTSPPPIPSSVHS
jgi:hypothetical protein